MSYYYLIAGLPDLSLNKAIDDRGKAKLDIGELMDTINRNLEPDDLTPFRYLIYPHDIRNFLTVLYKKHYDIADSAFLSPCLIDKDIIDNYSKHRGDLPPFMADFLREYEDQFTSMTPEEMEEKLWSSYYDQALECDPFVADYCRFEQKVRQFFAAYNSSLFDFLSNPEFDDPALNHVGVGKSLTSEIFRDFPFVEAMEELISNKNPLEIDAYSDRVIWNYLEQNVGFFGREQVYTYTIRLLMVAKWQRRNSERGEQCFIDLQENIKNKVRSQKTAVI